jgi:hypothetical protein
MIATIELPIDGAARKEICGRLSEALGAFIEATGKTDFADWREEDWDKFVGVAFDVAAVAVFTKRLIVVPPFVQSDSPPY